MKIRYPLGEQNFESIRSEGKVYVDKTGIIYDLISTYKYVFLSRPRRFGKSLLLSTIQAYFEGKKELFEGLKIYDLEKEWKRIPVLYLSLARLDSSDENSLHSALHQQFRIWEKELNLQSEDLKLAQRFSDIIIESQRRFKKKVVILIDEYDNPLINTLHRKDIHERNKSLLKSVYSNLKDLDQYIHFAMLTGVSQFTNTSIFSGLNNLNDITFEKTFSTICGFSEEDIKQYLWPGIEDFSRENGLTVEKTLATLKKEYDGYHFAKDLIDIYNPYSLLNCLAKKEIGNYWIKSGTPTFLMEKLKEKPMSYINIFNGESTELMLSERDTIYASPTALMYQTGYLTIKSYDPDYERYKLGIPNREIEKSLGSNLFQQLLNEEPQRDEEILKGLRKSLQEGDPEGFLKSLKSFFAGIPGIINHRDMVELNFENIIYVLLMTMGMNIQAEQSVSNGRIDLLIKTDKYIYVIELKYNSTPKKALEQIENKEYSLPYEYDGRKIFKIGVNFSKKTKNITGWKIV